MTTTHSSPSGFTFTLTTPPFVPESKRRPVAYKLIEVSNVLEDEDDLPTDPDEVMSAATAEKRDDAFNPEHLRLLDELNDLVAVALLTSWSSDTAISVAALLDLPSQDYATIRREVAPHASAMLPDFSPTPEDGTPTTP